MLNESITDFRNVIEEKLRFKKSALDQTEQHLRKFSVLRDANRTSSGREHVQSSKPSIRGRLGPKASLESRLGKFGPVWVYGQIRRNDKLQNLLVFFYVKSLTLFEIFIFCPKIQF